jgi:hypothetical protein
MQISAHKRSLREILASVRRPRRLRWLKVLQCIGHHPQLTANTLSIKLGDSTQNIHPFLKLSLETPPPMATRQKSNEAVDRLGRQKPEYLYSLAEWVSLAEIEEIIEEMENGSEDEIPDLALAIPEFVTPDPAPQNISTNLEVEMAENSRLFTLLKTLATEVAELKIRVTSLESKPQQAPEENIDEILNILGADSK